MKMDEYRIRMMFPKEVKWIESPIRSILDERFSRIDRVFPAWLTSRGAKEHDGHGFSLSIWSSGPISNPRYSIRIVPNDDKNHHAGSGTARWIHLYEDD